MLSVLADPILPVFAILFIGFVAGRLGQTSTEEARILNRFAMTVLLPIFVFRAVALAPFESFDLAGLAIYAATEVTLYLVGFFTLRRLFAVPTAEALLLAFCGIFANNAFYTLPLSLYLYDGRPPLPVTAVITLDSVLFFGGTMIVLEAMKQGQAHVGKIALRIARLPLVWALAAGAVVAILELSLPGPVDTFTDFVGQAASPIALFAMGVVLSSTRLIPEPAAVFASSIKIVFFPLALWAALTLLAPQTLDPPFFLLASAGPSGVMAFSMALLYGVRSQAIMQAIVYTCVLTLLSLAYLA